MDEKMIEEGKQKNQSCIFMNHQAKIAFSAEYPAQETTE